MKQIFIVASILMSMVVNTLGQTNSSYKSALSQWLNSSQSSNQMPMNTQLGVAAVMLVPQFMASVGENFNQRSELLEKYLDTQLDNDVMDIITPYFEAEIPIEDMQQLITYMNNENIASAMKKVEEASSDSVFAGTLALQLIYDMVGMSMGIEPSAVKLPDGCPQEYVDKVAEYIKTTSANSTLSFILNLLGNNEKDPQARDAVNKLSDYISKNSTNIMVRAYWGKVSMQDFDELLKLSRMDAYQKMTGVIKNIIADGNNIADQLKTRYNAWTSKQ